MNPTLFEVLATLRIGPCDASTLLARIRRLGGEQTAPSVPALYRHLKTALDRGWIAIETVEQDGPGRPPQTYALSAAGAEAAGTEARRLSRFTRLAVDDESPGTT